MELSAILEVLGTVIIAVLSYLYTTARFQNFKYKKSLVILIQKAKDGKVTEEEFQAIVDQFKAEQWPKQSIDELVKEVGE